MRDSASAAGESDKTFGNCYMSLEIRRMTLDNGRLVTYNPGVTGRRHGRPALRRLPVLGASLSYAGQFATESFHEGWAS